MKKPSSSIEFLDLPRFADDRGSFNKLFNKKLDVLKSFEIRQLNFVDNPIKGVFRGLHYQDHEFAESKIFCVLKGSIELVAFCFEKEHADFRKTFSFRLANGSSILVPRGFATGYLVLEDHSQVLYMSDKDYTPSAERGISWKDPILQLKFSDELVTSEKDKNWNPFEVS